MTVADEAIIYTGLDLEHAEGVTETKTETETETETETTDIEHETKTEDVEDDPTVQDVYETMTQEQQEVVHYMTALAWDRVGDRRYETGVDRGVLYLPDGTAVPWNGLTSVTETKSREVKSYFLDGVKFLDHYIPGTYEAKLSAFTYPDELEALLGSSEMAPGIVVYDQRANLFHLSYRTLIGNDIDGLDHGYQCAQAYCRWVQTAERYSQRYLSEHSPSHQQGGGDHHQVLGGTGR